MKRDPIFVGILWLVLTAIGEFFAFNTDFFPVAAAEEADAVDDAFRLLVILGVPVATLVLAVLGYSMVRFRHNGQPDTDGPSFRNYQPLAIAWLVITTALAVFVVFNPGLKGIEELDASESDADLVIQIEAEQWHWNVTYPDYNISYERALQIAMPVDATVRFEITSKDVIHSFWIPAFRIKMDAVPGRANTMYVTPTQTGHFDDDSTFRVQCAELCGTGHARMQMGVRVMEPDDFERWLEEARELTSAGEMDMDMGDMDMNGDEMQMDDMDSDEMDMDSDESTDMDDMQMDNGDSEMDMSGEGDDPDEMQMDNDNMDMNPTVEGDESSEGEQQ